MIVILNMKLLIRGQLSLMSVGCGPIVQSNTLQLSVHLYILIQPFPVRMHHLFQTASSLIAMLWSLGVSLEHCNAVSTIRWDIRIVLIAQ